MASSAFDRSSSVVAHNLRRLMARQDLSHADLVRATGVDDRTLRAVLRGLKRSRPSTLNKLAAGLGVSADELFAPPNGMSAAEFDMATNPIVEQCAAARPELFAGWRPSDFAELASRFGVGGQLTESGVAEAADQMNTQRELLEKAKVVLEGEHGHVLSELIVVLYDRAKLER